MYKYLEKLYLESSTIQEKLEWALTIRMYEQKEESEQRKLFKNIDGLKWTIRTREDSRHVPHFHVEKAGREGSFELTTGKLVKDEYCNLNNKEMHLIELWYKEYRQGLINMWNEIHTDRKVI